MSRREEIIRAAIRLAENSEPGKTNLSVRAVAKEAGIGASTLRHYFPTQADLMEAIARESLSVILSDFSIADTSIPPADRLYECCAQFLLSDEHQRLQLDNWLALHIKALGPEEMTPMRRFLEHGHEVTNDHFHRWLGILADEGHLDHAEVNPASDALFAMIDGLTLRTIITPDRMGVDLMHEQVKWLIAKILGNK